MSDSKKDPKYDSEDFLEIRIKSQLKLLPANFGSVYDGIKRRLIHDLFKYVLCSNQAFLVCWWPFFLL